jgi:hypothetical protein
MRFRDPQGSLVKEMLERYPKQPVFVVVRPLESHRHSSSSSSSDHIPDFDSDDSSTGGSSSSVWDPSVVSGTVPDILNARGSRVSNSRALSQDEDDSDVANTAVCLSSSQQPCCY